MAIADDKVLLKVGDALFTVEASRLGIEPFPRSRNQDPRGLKVPLGYRMHQLGAGLSGERAGGGSAGTLPSFNTKSR